MIYRYDKVMFLIDFKMNLMWSIEMNLYIDLVDEKRNVSNYSRDKI